eukprot:SAG31_NODE_148_length_22511_cov_20.369266_8_plen_241_part_00
MMRAHGIHLATRIGGHCTSSRSCKQFKCPRHALTAFSNTKRHCHYSTSAGDSFVSVGFSNDVSPQTSSSPRQEAIAASILRHLRLRQLQGLPREKQELTIENVSVNKDLKVATVWCSLRTGLRSDSSSDAQHLQRRQLAAAAATARAYLAHGPLKGLKRMPEIRYAIATPAIEVADRGSRRKQSRRRSRRHRMLGNPTEAVAVSATSTAITAGALNKRQAFDLALAGARAAADWETPDND